MTAGVTGGNCLSRKYAAACCSSGPIFSGLRRAVANRLGSRQLGVNAGASRRVVGELLTPLFCAPYATLSALSSIFHPNISRAAVTRAWRVASTTYCSLLLPAAAISLGERNGDDIAYQWAATSVTWGMGWSRGTPSRRAHFSLPRDRLSTFSLLFAALSLLPTFDASLP